MLPFTRPTLGPLEAERVSEVLASGWIASGPKLAAFESALADYLNGDGKVLAVSSGTAALEAALLATGIGPGDEVIVPSMTFAASANAVLRTGATPVFSDVDLATRNLTAAGVQAALSDRTRAVMPVHFAGLAADLEDIWALARQHRLRVVEDAAHAIGSGYQGYPIGSCGDLVCFSFQANKNITTIEGGAVVCFSDQDAEQIEKLRFHGISKDAEGNVDVSMWGGKMNLPDVSAAIGLVQLAQLDAWVARRRELAELYLAEMPVHPALHLPPDGTGHSWNMFNVRVDFAALGTDRSAFRAQLREQGVDTGLHYPPVHLFELYRGLGGKPGDHPNAEQIGTQTLTLPMYPTLSDAEARSVVHAFDSLLSAVAA